MCSHLRVFLVVAYFDSAAKQGEDAVPVLPFLLGFVFGIVAYAVAFKTKDGYGLRERVILVTSLYGLQVCCWRLVLMEACRLFRDGELPAQKGCSSPTAEDEVEGR